MLVGLGRQQTTPHFHGHKCLGTCIHPPASPTLKGEPTVAFHIPLLSQANSSAYRLKMSHAWGCATPDCTGDPCLKEPPKQEEFFESAPNQSNLDFRRLPPELRLRVLRHIHLGPPETAGYPIGYEELIIYDGRLEVGFTSMGYSSLEWYVC